MAVRPPTAEDAAGLADLMMSAYVGTIDYDGETLDQAVTEVAGWYAKESYPSTSLVAIHDHEIVAAILNRLWDPEGTVLIGYVMTASEWKKRGLARALLDQSLLLIFDDGHDEVFAWITNGNVPSETIFLGAGFEVVRTVDTSQEP